MKKRILIKNGTLVNEGTSRVADLLIKDGRIERIDSQIDASADIEINAEGKNHLAYHHHTSYLATEKNILV